MLASSGVEGGGAGVPGKTFELDQGMLARWHGVAERVAAHQVGAPTNARYRQTFSTWFWPAAERVEGALVAAEGRWDDTVHMALVSHYMRVQADASGDLQHKTGHSHLTVLRALRVAYAVVTGDMSLIGKADARWAAASLEAGGPFEAERRAFTAHAHPTGGRRARVDPDAVPFVVPFVTPQARGDTFSVAMRAQGTLRLAKVPAHDAPVVAVLSPSVPGGRPISVRRVRDALYRPVLAPGSWDALDVEAFAEALQGRSGWRDDPLRPPAQTDHPVLSVMEFTVAEGKPTPTILVARQAAIEAALVLACDLLAIDGVVHVRTEPPRTTLVSVTRAGRHRVERVETAWAMGTLRSWQSQEPTNLRRETGPGRQEILKDLPIPLFDAAGHRDLATAWRDGMGPDAEVFGYGTVDVPATPVAPVSTLDPDGLGYDPDRFVEALARHHGQDFPPGFRDETLRLVGEVLAGNEDAADSAEPTSSVIGAFLRAAALTEARARMALEAEMDGLGRFGP